MKLNNKTVFITGASRGIGAAAAKLFAQNGYFVCINYLKDSADAENTLKEVEKYSDGKLCQFDVSDIGAVRHAYEQLKNENIFADVLINNAGIGLFGVFHSLSDDVVNRLYGVNLFGSLNCTRVFLPDMIKNKRGCILNVASVGGERGLSCEVDYSVSKSALIGFTKALAKETGPSGIRVNCVSPGFIDTEMNSKLSYDDVQKIIDEIPAERIGDPDDVAKTLLFLASDNASYITGQIITVDGGWYV